MGLKLPGMRNLVSQCDFPEQIKKKKEKKCRVRRVQESFIFHIWNLWENTSEDEACQSLWHLCDAGGEMCRYQSTVVVRRTVSLTELLLFSLIWADSCTNSHTQKKVRGLSPEYNYQGVRRGQITEIEEKIKRERYRNVSLYMCTSILPGIYTVLCNKL